MLRYGDECGFPADWADELLEDCASNGDLMTLYSFVHCSDINRKIDDDRTALMHAAANGQTDLVKFLIEENVDATLLDAHNQSAIDIATDSGHLGLAGLIDVYSNGDWDRIRWADELLKRLRDDSLDKPIGQLLQTPKYSPCSQSVTELPEALGNYTWFKITDRVTIGIHNTDGMVYLTWLIDGHRLDDLS